MSTTSIRLPEPWAADLDRLANARNTTRSELIREAIGKFLDAARKGRPTDRGRLVDRLVTYEGSGRGDLAKRGEEILRKRLGAKRSR